MQNRATSRKAKTISEKKPAPRSKQKKTIPQTATPIDYYVETVRTYGAELLFLCTFILLAILAVWSEGITRTSLFLGFLGVLSLALLPRYRQAKLFVHITNSDIKISKHLSARFVGTIEASKIKKIELFDYTAVGRREVKYIPMISIYGEGNRPIEFSEFVGFEFKSSIRRFCTQNKIPLFEL